MARPEDEAGYERWRAADITLFVERELAGANELEFLIPHVGSFVIRKA